MTTSKVTPLLLIGGFGKRLWPLSTPNTPKPFCKLVPRTDKSLLQITLERVQDSKYFSDPILIGNAEHKPTLLTHLDDIGIDVAHILLEPASKGTAAALTLASLFVRNLFGDDQLVLALPADHLITPEEHFYTSINKAITAAEEDAIVTFGVTPTRPETGFGYIQSDEATATYGGHKIRHFVEKPDRLHAAQYLVSKNYYWNTGLFMYKAGTLLKEVEKLEPNIHEQMSRAMERAKKSHNCMSFSSQHFEPLSTLSFDHAVMEKTVKGIMFHADFGWSDVGSWEDIWQSQSMDKNSDHNILNGEIFTNETKDCFIHAEDKPARIIGVEGLAIVSTTDGLLVCRRDQLSKLKEIMKTH